VHLIVEKKLLKMLSGPFPPSGCYKLGSQWLGVLVIQSPQDCKIIAGFPCYSMPAVTLCMSNRKLNQTA